MGGCVAIIEFAWNELKPGVLADAFTQGAVAAMIAPDDTFRDLWDRLMADQREKLPWEVTLAEIAHNHHGSGEITDSLGDVIYFRPSLHGHIARKFEITQGSGQFAMRPGGFVQDGILVTPSVELLADCWALVARIMAAMTPDNMAPPFWRVSVQRLKYQCSVAALDGLTALVGNSLGRWGQLGFAIDTARARAMGPFSAKGLCDVFGLMSLLPLASWPAKWANARFADRSRVNRLEAGEHLIEKPHYDTRYFSAISGSRDTICTQVFVDGGWVNLPIARDSLAIIPGKLARRELGLPATMHRVIHREPTDPPFWQNARDFNTTLLFGAK